ncbi:MAG: hypothetical protein WC765_08785 [Phycisphaerae bacterium]|jgi:hypothetical protein
MKNALFDVMNNPSRIGVLPGALVTIASAREILWSVIMCGILVGSLAMAQTNDQAPGDATNLLKNGSFEQEQLQKGQFKPLAWHFTSPASLYAAVYLQEGGPETHSDKSAIGIIFHKTSGGEEPSPRDLYAGWYSDLIEVTPGAVYRVKGWVKTSECVGKGAWLWLYGSGSQKRGEMLVVRDPSVPIQYFVDTQDWQECSLEIHIPENVQWLGVVCRLDGDGKAWFDDVSVSPVK